MNTTTAAKTTARAMLDAMIEGQSTDQLLALHAELDAMKAKTQEARLISALAADKITERLDIDAEIEVIFMDDDFGGTYHEAILMAMAAKGMA